jgi:hypothetical protein
MTYNLLSAKGPRPRSYKGANGHDICQLHTPVDFPCVVDGKTLTASLTHAEDDSTQWLYHVRFSDGHKAVFAMNRKLQCWVENAQKVPSSYARAINEDLLMIYQFNPLYPPFCLSVRVKEENVKVWAKMEQSGCWGVFFKGDFRFFLHFFTGKWQAETIDAPKSYIVPEISDTVIQKLNSIIRFKLAPTS